MTLRTRLLLVLVGVVLAGLVITDVVTYTSLRSFLLARVDPQLTTIAYPMGGELLASNASAISALRGSDDLPGAPGLRPQGDFYRNRFGPGGGSPVHSNPAPIGTFAELVNAGGQRVGNPAPAFPGVKTPPAPLLPHPLPPGADKHRVFFSAESPDPDAISYRVLLQSVEGDSGLLMVVAIPLTDVSQTLGRLLLVEVLVSAAVVVGLGVLAWWLVRRDLRPLEQMAVTAGEIAGGDLGRRVAPAEPRTEVGRLGLSLNAMLGEIETAFAAQTASEDRLRRFLADASHELRTPLTSIRGYAELFDLGARGRPADLARSMHHIREEADRMSVLVDDLLLLARLDQERPLDLQPVDLVEVVRKSVDAARVAVPERTVLLQAPPSCLVRCDEHRVRQVVDNLLGNALRHSPGDQPVTVRVVPDAGATGGSGTSGDPSVVTEIADRGPGIPPGEAERIFEPFYRADPSRARTTGGAGLGLAITAAIVRAHGGTVGVRPEPGGGSCFWFRLERIEAEPPAAVLPTAVPQDRQS